MTYRCPHCDRIWTLLERGDRLWAKWDGVHSRAIQTAQEGMYFVCCGERFAFES